MKWGKMSNSSHQMNSLDLDSGRGDMDLLSRHQKR